MPFFISKLINYGFKLKLDSKFISRWNYKKKWLNNRISSLIDIKENGDEANTSVRMHSLKQIYIPEYFPPRSRTNTHTLMSMIISRAMATIMPMNQGSVATFLDDRARKIKYNIYCLFLFIFFCKQSQVEKIWSRRMEVGSQCLPKMLLLFV